MLVYQCLAIILLIPIVLALGSIPFRIHQFSFVDIQNPRPQAARLRGAGARIVNAQKNAWEALVMFTVAIFIARSADVPLTEMETACLIFVAARILHAVFYISGKGILRILAFFIATGSALLIVAKAFL